MSAPRSERFSDTHFTGDRPYNKPNPFANQPVPSDFQTIKNLLDSELKNSKRYKVTWDEAAYVLKRKKELLPSEYFVATTPDECYTAVIAYTLDEEVEGSPLYQDFNAKFRALSDQASWDSFPYKSLYYLLTKAIPGIKNYPSISDTAYRGIRNIHFDPEPKPFADFYFDYFASTTTDRSTAEHFMGKNGTLVELRNGSQVAMGISKYSLFNEEEVLVFPKNKFRVKSFTKGQNIDVLVIEQNGTV